MNKQPVINDLNPSPICRESIFKVSQNPNFNPHIPEIENKIPQQELGNIKSLNSKSHSPNLKISCNKIYTGHKEVKGKVNALRTQEQIEQLKNYFLYHENKRTQNKSKGLRNYCLTVFGMNTMLRISDIVNFKIGNIINSDGSFKTGITIYEQKTGKKRAVIFNQAIREAVSLYLSSLKEYSLDDFLFKSNKSKNGVQQPILPRSAWRIYNEAGKALGFTKIGLNLGTHSLRKTGARRNYEVALQQGNPEALLIVSKALNHSSVQITQRYIDISEADVLQMMNNNI
jgi:integrase